MRNLRNGLAPFAGFMARLAIGAAIVVVVAILWTIWLLMVLTSLVFRGLFRIS